MLAALVTVYTVFTNGGPPGVSGRSNAKTRRCKIKITDDRRSDWDNMSVLLCEDDIPGSSLAGRKPAELKLRLWLKCRNGLVKGLQTKA